MVYELGFPLHGDALPHDHGYAVYSALCHQADWLHNPDNKVLVGPVGGLGPNYRGKLSPDRARLRFRVKQELLPLCLDLAGRELSFGAAKMGLGMPEISKLVPLPALQARIVTIKGFQELDPFLEAARRQLQERGIAGEVNVLAHPKNGEPWRRVLRVRDKVIVGFSVAVCGLSAVDSIALQEVGLGGRGKMGCGFFVPLPA